MSAPVDSAGETISIPLIEFSDSAVADSSVGFSAGASAEGASAANSSPFLASAGAADAIASGAAACVTAVVALASSDILLLAPLWRRDVKQGTVSAGADSKRARVERGRLHRPGEGSCETRSGSRN